MPKRGSGGGSKQTELPFARLCIHHAARMQQQPEMLAGVIEGFYGPPWSRAERIQLFDWMRAAGLNSYLYAPKDDLKHRALWREEYTSEEFEALKAVIAAAHHRQIRFIFALSPGLDIRFSDAAEIDSIKKRFLQLAAAGCRSFALLFDDIPDAMQPADQTRFQSFAAGQAFVANSVFQWARERIRCDRFLFCPTAYCGRMAKAGLGGPGYLEEIGRELLPEIEIFWTGPDIISRSITCAHVKQIGQVLRRKPLIWDNLHANDYDGRRFYCGPYSGRDSEIRAEVSGILSNPNNELPLNYIPVRTLGEFARAAENWDPRAHYLSALRDWLAAFETVRGPLALDDLTLFADCFYLPFDEGECARELMSEARGALRGAAGALQSFQEKARRLREFCIKLAELRDRRLFYSLSRRVWELREELDLLLRYTEFMEACPPGGAFRSDYHLHGTFRGGFIPKLQSLLRPERDGSIASAL